MQLDGIPSLDQCPVENTWRQKISVMMRGLGTLPQVECPLKHNFLPGIYLREIFMPADTVVIGKIHKTRHFNILQKGKVLLISEHDKKILEGPITFVSEPGIQKLLYIYEDTFWSTVHLTNNTDLESLEAELIEADDSYPILDRLKEKLDIELAAQKVLL